MKKLSRVQIQKFQNIVWDFYTKNQRNTLPWRKALTPYKVLVSEVMLQQTQVDRVVPFFKQWMRLFPNWRSLADASQVDVLRTWKGLGYNSRALRLQKLARIVAYELNNKLPRSRKELEKLPGIGPYTAGAICAFAHNEHEVFIETNIRTVYFHHFLHDQENISDTDLTTLVEQTLPQENPREWYWALMDYGSHLKRQGVRLNTKSKHYTKQSKFAGSDRQIRGAILEILLKEGKQTCNKLVSRLAVVLKKEQEKSRVARILLDLAQEGFVCKRGVYYGLSL